MKVKAPVKLNLTAEQIVIALREAGYDIPQDVKIDLINSNGYYYPAATGVDKKEIMNINWDISVEVGGPNKCEKDLKR